MTRRRGASRRGGEGELARAIAEMPFGAGAAIAGVLVVIGVFVSFLPPGQGWFALLPQTKTLFFALAFFVFVAASAGALRRWSDGRLFNSGTPIEQLSREQFERYLAAYYRSKGFTVRSRGGSVADGGVDLVLDDAQGRRILQAKHWRTYTVGIVPLRALWGVREDEGAHGAVFVTSGRFTKDALEFARGKALELVDGARLRRMVQAGRALSPPTLGETAPVAQAHCPRCREGTLVPRVARKGSHAGSEFLGCSRYPRCTFTRNVEVPT